MTLPDFRDPAYLARGTARQRAAFAALDGLGVFARLAAYDPVLVGTVPLGLDVAASDLDVLCEAHDLERFAADVAALYGDRAGFAMGPVAARQGAPSRTASFTHAGFAVELFGQARAVAAQRAYRHLVVEARLLALAGAALRARIVDLRRQGLKTEPAFARALGLGGDPHRTLLDLADRDDDALLRRLRAASLA